MMTLFVDSAYCTKTKAAGWGAWVKGNQWAAGVTRGAEIRQPLANSAQAKLWGIVEALRHVTETFERPSTILIQCNNLRAVSLMAYHLSDFCRPSNSTRGMRIDPAKGLSLYGSEGEAISDIRIVAKGVPLMVRHIFSRRDGGAPTWVTTECERKANVFMNGMRDRLIRSAA